MKLSEGIILAVLLLAVAYLGMVVAETMGTEFSSDEVCESARGENWSYVDAERDDGVYCRAPNGSVHRTIIHLTGPQHGAEGLLSVTGVVLLAALMLGLVRSIVGENSASDPPSGENTQSRG